MNFSKEENNNFDNIIEKRRSIRSFKTDLPAKAMIEEIIHAGLWAPYVGLSYIEGQEFRKFFVIKKGNPISLKITDLLQQQSKVGLVQMEKMLTEKPFLREKAKGIMERIKSMAENGFPDLLNAPYMIIIAERKGMPPAEKQTLAHVIQNMWLKATALGLGFRLVSAVENLAENNDFCALLGMKSGDFAFTSCFIGYPAEEPLAGKRPTDSEVTKWL